MTGPVRTIWLTFLLALCLFLIVLPSFEIQAQEGTGQITLLDLEGPITPVQADYLSRGFEQADAAGSSLIIVRMDTPGGLDETMRDIIQLINDSPLPVVVFVVLVFAF